MLQELVDKLAMPVVIGIIDIRPAVFLPLLSVSVGLLLWRLWRFTVAPVLWPHDPKELPYWVPG